jgi:general secretion pathway protein C
MVAGVGRQKNSSEWFIWLGLMIGSILAADLLRILIKQELQRQTEIPRLPQGLTTTAQKDRVDSSAIITRNIFSLDGVIPETLFQIQSREQGQSLRDNEPVPSSLPLTLLGTIVHSNPARSIANVQVQPKNTAVAVRVGNTIDTFAELVSVERQKIIFRNRSNQRLEFIEMKDQNKLSFTTSRPNASLGPVRQVAPNQFEVPREEVAKRLGNLGALLQEAASQPRRNAAGEIDGFQIVAVQPGSILNQFVQPGDTILAVNGVPINSPESAVAAFQQFQGATTIRLTRDRGGQVEDVEYIIK